MVSIETIAAIIGCIILFIYAIRQLSIVFEELFTERATQILQKYTSNLFKSIITGVFITLLLDSSSAVIILTIIFINAQTIDLKRGIGISLGANIGTTLQSQFFVLDVMQYSFILLVLGVLHLFIKKKQLKLYFSAVFLVGLLFFSLFIISEFVTQPETYQYIKDWLKESEKSPLITAFAGGFFTLIIQSSGAMVGLAITLAKEGLLSQAAGIAIMMGAEIGTCSTSLIAALGSTRDAILLALFNLVFNFVAITLGLIFFDQFVFLIDFLFENYKVSSKIANAHVLFNILAVLIIIPIIRPFTYITTRSSANS